MTEARSDRPIWLTGSDRRGWDHVRVHLQMLEDPRLGANELAVYLGLAAHAEIRHGVSRPAQDTIGRYAALSWSSVHRSLKVLEEAGYVEIERRPGRSSRYHLLPMPALPTPVTVEGVPGTPGTGAEQVRDPDRGPSHSRDATPVRDADEREPLNESPVREPENETPTSSSSDPSGLAAAAGGPPAAWGFPRHLIDEARQQITAPLDRHDDRETA